MDIKDVGFGYSVAKFENQKRIKKQLKKNKKNLQQSTTITTTVQSTKQLSDKERELLHRYRELSLSLADENDVLIERINDYKKKLKNKDAIIEQLYYEIDNLKHKQNE